ncbi:MAG: PKD domain-containing protein, partial [Haloglomus sp.]
MRNRPVAFVVTVAALVLAAGGVASAGEPPLADAGLDQQVERNTTVLLDAAGSRDPDGTIQSYQWSIETPDGREIRPLDPDVARTSFIARQSGRYEVTVTITDDDGRTASDTLYVDVSSAPVDTPASVDTPTPDGTPGPADTPAPTTTSPAVEESTPDPSSTTSRPSSRDTPSPAAGDPTPGLSADVTSSEDGALDPASPDAPPPGATATEPASPEPTDSGTDAAASAACASGTTRVKSVGCLDAGDPPATVDIEGKRYVRQWSAHTYTASVSDRPSGNERLTWSGGMGTGATRTKMFTQPPGSTVTISATVADGEGHTSSDTIVVHVTEENRPPEVRIEGPTTACVGEPVELEGYAIASENRDRITEATWHGDPTFVPQQPGQYEVGFSARDERSQTARTSHTVTARADGACRSEPVDRTGGTDKLL